MHFSDTLFNFINGLANKNHIVDIIFISLSKSIPYILMLLTISTYLYGVIKKDRKIRGICVDTVIQTVIAFTLSQIIGTLIPFKRPFVNNPSANLLYYHEANSSFPSDHSLGSMSLSIGLFKVNDALGKLAMCLSILVGFSRIYVGHHYPLDVLGGFILAFLVNKLYRSIIKNKIRSIYFKVEKNIPILADLVA